MLKRMVKMINIFRKKHRLYNLRKECAKWVTENLGEEFVEEFLEKYDKINSGVPIGNFLETAAFVDMIGKIKEDILGGSNHD